MVRGDAITTETCFVTYFQFRSLPVTQAKKRLKDAAREGDNRLSKKARMLAESSQGPKGSILRHMQAGIPGAANRMPAEKKGSCA